MVFDKWSGRFWFVRLDTVFDNPGLRSYMHLTRDVVGFGGLNSFSYKQNCSNVFYVSYLILFSDLMQKCKKCGLAVADFFSGISWDPHEIHT